VLNPPLSEIEQSEGAPFTVLNGELASPVLIICDHASRFVPPECDGLGLEETLLYRHIAWDIGAADVARRLSNLLRAPAVFCGTSRLVIDCNRELDDPASIPAISDGIEVPGNVDLDAAERQRRVEQYFLPYHGEIGRRIRAQLDAGVVPALVSVHSFTPMMNHLARPWHVGLLWDANPQMAAAVIEQLRRDPTLVIGENQPYNGWEPRGYAIHAHGEAHGLPMTVFEMRQDLIDTHHGAESWAHILAAALRPVLADKALYRMLR
jgi:predicted N-formylglutamate amidohydrolase